MPTEGLRSTPPSGLDPEVKKPVVEKLSETIEPEQGDGTTEGTPELANTWDGERVAERIRREAEDRTSKEAGFDTAVAAEHFRRHPDDIPEETLTTLVVHYLEGIANETYTPEALQQQYDRDPLTKIILDAAIPILLVARGEQAVPQSQTADAIREARAAQTEVNERGNIANAFRALLGKDKKTLTVTISQILEQEGKLEAIKREVAAAELRHEETLRRNRQEAEEVLEAARSKARRIVEDAEDRMISFRADLGRIRREIDEGSELLATAEAEKDATLTILAEVRSELKTETLEREIETIKLKLKDDLLKRLQTLSKVINWLLNDDGRSEFNAKTGEASINGYMYSNGSSERVEAHELLAKIFDLKLVRRSPGRFAKEIIPKGVRYMPKEGQPIERRYAKRVTDIIGKIYTQYISMATDDEIHSLRSLIMSIFKDRHVNFKKLTWIAYEEISLGKQSDIPTLYDEVIFGPLTKKFFDEIFAENDGGIKGLEGEE